MQKSTPEAFAAVVRSVAVVVAFGLGVGRLPVAGAGDRVLDSGDRVEGVGAPDGVGPAAREGITRILVGYRVETWADRKQILARYALTLRRSFPVIQSEVYDVAPDRLGGVVERLSRDVRVAFVETDSWIPLALNELQWNFDNTGQRGGQVDADVDGPEAWAITSDCHGVTVAVIDTGLDLDHPDLVDNVWQNPGEAGETSAAGVDDDGNGFIDDVNGWNFRDDDNDVRDFAGHGTHVAGIIGAQAKTDVSVRGVCTEVQIMPVVSFGFKRGLTSDVVAGILYALDEGADVINGSFAGDHGSPLFQRAIEAASDMGVLVVLGAGNDGVDLDEVLHTSRVASSDGETGGLDNVLVVAATDRYDQLADYSNYGEHTVHLAAPGSSIYSTFPPGTYRSLSGTSMAVPHVSGAAALVLALNWCLTPAQVRAILMGSADPVSALDDAVACGGRLNLHSALLETPDGCP